MRAQYDQYASDRLKTLLACMAPNLPANVGRIGSIADHYIAEGTKTFEQCSQGGCSHGANSCHYGGRSCVSGHKSYAVDFGDERNGPLLKPIAEACGAHTYQEGTNFHVSVGSSCGCL
jgi:hypothetical protein